MKINKNFIIPFLICLFMSLLIIFVQGAPIFIVFSVLLFIVVPILVIQQKSNNDWGKMFIFGIPLSIVFILLIICVFALANNFEWLKDIVLWPYDWRNQ